MQMLFTAQQRGIGAWEADLALSRKLCPGSGHFGHLVQGAVEGQAVPASTRGSGQEHLLFVALVFNHFLPLLVFIACIFPITVSLGFHPF